MSRIMSSYYSIGIAETRYLMMEQPVLQVIGSTQSLLEIIVSARDGNEYLEYLNSFMSYEAIVIYNNINM